jgi:hypothetical protein
MVKIIYYKYTECCYASKILPMNQNDVGLMAQKVPKDQF